MYFSGAISKQFTLDLQKKLGRRIIVMPRGGFMDLKDIITSVAAVVGMVLGIYNFVRARSADRVRLRVIPKAASFRGRDQSGRDFYLHNRDRFDVDHPTRPPGTLALEVINLSKFAVTVDEVGLMPFFKRERFALVVPILPDGKPWPRKLEPRESVTVHFDVKRLRDFNNIQSARRAYASTACGTTCCGSSGALREFVRSIRNAA
jgi:hypothetical protein